jgi:hypothetical protein
MGDRGVVMGSLLAGVWIMAETRDRTRNGGTEIWDNGVVKGGRFFFFLGMHICGPRESSRPRVGRLCERLWRRGRGVDGGGGGGNVALWGDAIAGR